MRYFYCVIISEKEVSVIQETKIALISVWTDVVNSGVEQDYQKGYYLPIEITKLHNTLHQNLCYGNIAETLICDLSDDDNFKDILDPNTGTYELGDYLSDNVGYKILRRNRSTNELLFNYLKSVFLDDPTINNIYENYFLVFAFDRPSEVEFLSGHVAGIGIPLAIVYNFRANESVTTPPRSEGVVSHEIMHGYGLYHTHQDEDNNGVLLPIVEPERKYTYPNGNDLSSADKNKATDNVMSYSNIQRTLWQWQRKFIIIKKEEI